MKRLPVIVLTPVKNEEWIIGDFLKTTSMFADCIIIADQYSCDQTREIASSFEKVVLIKNEDKGFDENYRQKILINKARELYPGKKVLLALDADEIITYHSLQSREWDKIHSLPEDTVITFERPDILPSLNKCIRGKLNDFPLGFIDNGREHVGIAIHGHRLPFSKESAKFECKDIKFLHLAMTRELEYRAKQRYYSVLENELDVQAFYRRLNRYSKKLSDYIADNVSTLTPTEWTDGWVKSGILTKSIESSDFNNYNTEVLIRIKKYGVNRFLLDDIWDMDWGLYSSKIQGTSHDGLIKNPAQWKLLPLIFSIWILKLLKKINVIA